MLWTAFKIVIISILIYWFFIEYIDYTPKNKQFVENFSQQVAARILEKLPLQIENEKEIKPLDLEKINKEREDQILGTTLNRNNNNNNNKNINNNNKNINNKNKNINNKGLPSDVESELIETEEKTDQYYINTKLRTIPNQLPPILKVDGEDSEVESEVPNQTNYVNENYKLDNGVLYDRNFEGEKSLSMYQELTLSQITPLITQVMENNHQYIEDLKEEMEEYKKTIKAWKKEKGSVFQSKIKQAQQLLMKDINKVIEASKLTTKYHSYIPYQIKDFNLVRQTYSADKKYINLIGAIHIYRKNRIRYFALHFNIIIPNKKASSITSSHYYIEELKVAGVKTLPIIHKDDKIANTDLPFLQDRTLGELMHSREGGDFKCFHPKGEKGELPDYTNKLDCISYHKEVDAVGIWDEPCKTNEECPFYQANKNYDNQFGGCILGKCQLPIGLDQVGFRHWNKLTQPYCHQCDLLSDKMDKSISDKQCCALQKDAIEAKKISLKSPDYIFENDSNLRNV